MLLTGTFFRCLDEKQRLAIPKRLREAMGMPANRRVYLAPGTDGSLALYPEAAFERLAEQLDRASPNRPDVRAFSRLFYAQAQQLEVDRQGRVRIPPELFSLARLTKEIVLLGVRDHLEIWDREHWEEYLQQKQTSYDQFAETAFLQPQLVPDGRMVPAVGRATVDGDARPVRPR